MSDAPSRTEIEARVAVLEQIARDIRDDNAAMRSRVDDLDVRLRGVEVSIGRLEGKIDALTGTIVGQTSAALAKLPSWWHMPAVVLSTAGLIAAAYAGLKYLQAHGLF